jgi:hypothetical protein
MPMICRMKRKVLFYISGHVHQSRFNAPCLKVHLLSSMLMRYGTKKVKVARDIVSVEMFLHVQVIFSPVPQH